MAQMTMKMFLPQFQALCNNITDEKIDEFCDFVINKIDYIKTGYDSNADEVSHYVDE